jgi:hypothetical protein
MIYLKSPSIVENVYPTLYATKISYESIHSHYDYLQK